MLVKRRKKTPAPEPTVEDTEAFDAQLQQIRDLYAEARRKGDTEGAVRLSEYYTELQRPGRLAADARDRRVTLTCTPRVCYSKRDCGAIPWAGK